MLQAFVPASSEAGRDGGSKKRRRPVAAGEGEEVSSLYESIVRPGEGNRAREMAVNDRSFTVVGVRRVLFASGELLPSPCNLPVPSMLFFLPEMGTSTQLRCYEQRATRQRPRPEARLNQWKGASEDTPLNHVLDQLAFPATFSLFARVMAL